jgi:hypothetical protein
VVIRYVELDPTGVGDAVIECEARNGASFSGAFFAFWFSPYADVLPIDKATDAPALHPNSYNLVLKALKLSRTSNPWTSRMSSRPRSLIKHHFQYYIEAELQRKYENEGVGRCKEMFNAQRKIWEAGFIPPLRRIRSYLGCSRCPRFLQSEKIFSPMVPTRQ